ncbi:MAG: mechanosensitive ion channel family protein, partial [Promicromonosporaceae bacterium]|nr:mechanosensitive ion channel family protein [Promicromonosporaceae bacterium]
MVFSEDLVEETVEAARDFWAWFTDRPLHVLLIVVIGTLTLLLARRLITVLTERIASGYSKAYDDAVEGLSEHDPDGTAEMQLLVSPEVKARRAARARTVGSVLRSATNIVLVSAMIFMILNVIGAGRYITPLLASAGVVGVAIGFGAQSLVRDFLSGIFILIEDQYGVGDRVDLGGGAVGVVEKMDLRLTHVRAFDGTLWHVRNGEILRAGNQTQQWARAVAEIRIPLGADVETAKTALRRAVDTVVSDPRHSSDLLEVPSIRGVESITSGSYGLTIHGRVRPGMQLDIARALREAAYL